MKQVNVLGMKHMGQQGTLAHLLQPYLLLLQWACGLFGVVLSAGSLSSAKSRGYYPLPTLLH